MDLTRIESELLFVRFILYTRLKLSSFILYVTNEENKYYPKYVIFLYKFRFRTQVMIKHLQRPIIIVLAQCPIEVKIKISMDLFNSVK